MKYWGKRHEVLDGQWVGIGFWRYLYFRFFLGIVTCTSRKYPGIDKDRGFAHSVKRG